MHSDNSIKLFERYWKYKNDNDFTETDRYLRVNDIDYDTNKIFSRHKIHT